MAADQASDDGPITRADLAAYTRALIEAVRRHDGSLSIAEEIRLMTASQDRAESLLHNPAPHAPRSRTEPIK